MSDTPVPTISTDHDGRVISALLERLYAALSRGPAINCLPHKARQRLDFATIGSLGGTSASEVLTSILSHVGKCRVKVALEKLPPLLPDAKEEQENLEISRKRRDQQEKIRILKRIALIADEATMYEQDTGAYILYLGFPLLSIPPSPSGNRGYSSPSRVLAPIAFIPLAVSANAIGNTPFAEFACAASGSDRVISNSALHAWLERQVGKSYPEDLFEDEEGADPIREIMERVAHVASLLDIPSTPDLSTLLVNAVPTADNLPALPAVLPCAVLGLYRLDNQNAIADLRALREPEACPPAVASFLTLNANLTQVVDAPLPITSEETSAPFTYNLPPLSETRLVTHVDPCQRLAVVRARTSRGLVIHGPPGTGKSQTITNIIGDYLARGERVLVVCEKRTALDVVKYRLDHIRLGHLCAVVHDASRDRQPLYKGVREQLENLADAPQESDPSRELNRTNTEAEALATELESFFTALSTPDEGSGLDFHELAGRWLECFTVTDRARKISLDPDLATVPLESVLVIEGEVVQALKRAEMSGYADNGWVSVHGTTLDSYLLRDVYDLRSTIDAVISAGNEADSLRVQGLPGYSSERIGAQGAARMRVGNALAALIETYGNNLDLCAHVARLELAQRKPIFDRLKAIGSSRDQVAKFPLDPELRLVHDSTPWPIGQVATGIASLADYLNGCTGLFSFLRFGARRRAAATLVPLGLALSPGAAQRAKSFLEGLRDRALLASTLYEVFEGSGITASSTDSELVSQYNQLFAVLQFFAELESEVDAQSAVPCICQALAAGGTEKASGLAASLVSCSSESAAIVRLLDSIQATKLISPEALRRMAEKVCFGRSLADDWAKLRADFDVFEHVLRFEEEISRFPSPLARSLRLLALADVPPDLAWIQLCESLFKSALMRRLKDSPELQRIDTERIAAAMARLGDLMAAKQELECRGIRYLWQKRQRSRLLALTGSRLNTDGADLRRRLSIRGRNSSRIRQVIQQGLGIGGGDPLFDVVPVWMASPETVAQIFPLQPMFDVVIFDEASQCRLEQGLPALARGHRVVVAGDTKQLPPTRFFQPAVVSAGDDDDGPEDGQDAFFSAHQSEIEDLLSAALNVEIEQSFLDVHYRSSCDDLIGFSNESFYGSRLQAIPGHPNNRREEPAVQLHQVAGLYKDRQNQGEADYIVSLVKGLLRRAEPPSIGIVSFNLSQRDLIAERIDEAAESDSNFRAVLDEARARKGAGSFEGLFIKNLEGVQGDERDHIIISTTFGPDANGRFYRRFGPLALQGGERRLNVIVTRARHQVDVVTSIPASVYREAVAVPEGKRPNGAWFLMEYLRYAERLGESYARSRESAMSDSYPDRQMADETAPQAVTKIVGPGVRSRFIEAFASWLRDRHQISSILYYGTEGFCVDIAFLHPTIPNRLTIGILCDAARYGRAVDRVAWDNFQEAVHRGQRWLLFRIWSPHFFRDPEGTISRILLTAEKAAREAALPPEVDAM